MRLIAALLIALPLAFGTTSAYAQGAPTITDRLSDADLRFWDAVTPKLASKTVTMAEAIQLFTRGFEYYRKGDYFAASYLFVIGKGAFEKMGWVQDEAFFLADTYLVLSFHKHCVSEPAACRAELVSRLEVQSPAKRPVLGVAEATALEFMYRELVRSRRTAPVSLAQEVRHECRAAYQRYRNACAAVGDSAKECSLHRRPECD